MNEQEIKDDIINYIDDVAVTDEQYDELLSERNHMIEALTKNMINEYKEQGLEATYQLMTALLKGTVMTYSQRKFRQLKTLYDHMLERNGVIIDGNRVNDHDCVNINGHKIDDDIDIIRKIGDYIEAEVYCKHKCDHYGTADYKADYNKIRWKKAY
jgi:hypothetical protein